MRAIVSCIVDDSSDLLTNSNEGIPGAIEADDEGSDDENWAPEPVHAGPGTRFARCKFSAHLKPASFLTLPHIHIDRSEFGKEKDGGYY